jgi:hypothetical protein
MEVALYDVSMPQRICYQDRVAQTSYLSAAYVAFAVTAWISERVNR